MNKLHILGNNEETNEDQQDDGKVPTVAAPAASIIHPMFQDPDSGQPIPPPPDHEYRMGIQMSIVGKGRVVQEQPGLFFISGDSVEEMADMAKLIILQGLNEFKKQNSVIKPVFGNEADEILKKFNPDKEH